MKLNVKIYGHSAYFGFSFFTLEPRNRDFLQRKGGNIFFAVGKIAEETGVLIQLFGHLRCEAEKTNSERFLILLVHLI